MEYVIVLIIGCIGGSIFGWKYRERTAIKLLQEIEISEFEDHLKNSSISITIERDNGVIFCYNKNSGDYMAHGDDWDQLTEHLVTRFPDKKFVCDEDNLKEMGFYF